MRFDYATFAQPEWWSTNGPETAMPGGEDQALTYAGEEGWELVAVIRDTELGTKFFFKRPRD